MRSVRLLPVTAVLVVLLAAPVAAARAPDAADQPVDEPTAEPTGEPTAADAEATDAEATDPDGADADPLPFAPNPYLDHGFGGAGAFGGFTGTEPPPAVLVGSGADSLLRAPDLRAANAPTLLERYGSQGLALDNGVGMAGGDQGLASIASGVFAVAAWLAQAVVAIVQWAFSLELFDFIGGAVAGIVGSLRDTLYLPFVQAGVILAGLYAMWHGLVRRRGTFAAESLAWTVFALTAAAVFFAFPSAFISGANHLSTGFARTVLAGVSTVDPKPLPADGAGATATFTGHPGDAQLRVAADRLWRVFVYEPWLVLQFGEAEAGAAYGERLLASRTITVDEYGPVEGDPEALQELGDRKREEFLALQEEILADARVAPWFRGRRSVDRLGVATLALVGVLVGGVLLAFVAASVLLAQIAFLLLVLLGPLALLIGIHPGTGRVIALRWAELALGLLIKRVALGALLAVVLVVNGLLLEATQALGWLVAVGLQALVIAAVVVYRKPFSRLFAPTTVPRIATEAGRRLRGSRAIAPQQPRARPQAATPQRRARVPLPGRPSPRTAREPDRPWSPQIGAPRPPEERGAPARRARRRTISSPLADISVAELLLDAAAQTAANANGNGNGSANANGDGDGNGAPTEQSGETP